MIPLLPIALLKGKEFMATSIIRSLVNRVSLRHDGGETMEIVKDVSIPTLIGGALGALGANGGLDKGGVPVDATVGAAIVIGTILTPMKADARETVRSAGSNMIAVGSSRVAARLRKGGSIHGEFDGGSFGTEPLVAAAAKL